MRNPVFPYPCQYLLLSFSFGSPCVVSGITLGFEFSFLQWLMKFNTLYIYVDYWIYSFLDSSSRFWSIFSKGSPAYFLLICKKFKSLYNVHKQARFIYFNFLKNTLNWNKSYIYTHTHLHIPHAQSSWSNPKRWLQFSVLEGNTRALGFLDHIVCLNFRCFYASMVTEGADSLWDMEEVSINCHGLRALLKVPIIEMVISKWEIIEIKSNVVPFLISLGFPKPCIPVWCKDKRECWTRTQVKFTGLVQGAILR